MHLHGAICGRWDSLNTRDIRTPTPSNTPNKIPHATAEPRADRGPPEDRCVKYAIHVTQIYNQKNKDSLRRAKQPPVMNPDMMAFHASSFCRQPLTAQSNVENMPPQTPKFPPVTGARAFIEEMAPTKRSP